LFLFIVYDFNVTLKTQITCEIPLQ